MKSLTPDSQTLATALRAIRDRMMDGDASLAFDEDAADNLTDAIARVEDYVVLSRNADSAFDRGAAATRIRVLRSAAKWAKSDSLIWDKSDSLLAFSKFLDGLAADWAKRGGA